MIVKNEILKTFENFLGSNPENKFGIQWGGSKSYFSLIMGTPVVWNKRLKPFEPTPKISCQNSNCKVPKVSWEISELEPNTRQNFRI
jgi:hypothetical protein